MNIKTVKDADELAETAAKIIITLARQAVAIKNNFSIALSGGSTPKRLYELLANTDRDFVSEMPWDRIIFFFSDERYVPPSDPESNYRMANEAMLSHVPVLQSHIHRFLTETSDPHAVAVDYQWKLRASFETVLPRFDLILLGLGPDGHTASLFPGTTALNETKRWVVETWVEKFQSFRFTMTLPVLNNAAQVMFLVSGKDKANILRDVLIDGPNAFPAQLIKPTNGELTWLVDEPAASKLAQNT